MMSDTLGKFNILVVNLYLSKKITIMELFSEFSEHGRKYMNIPVNF